MGLLARLAQSGTAPEIRAEITTAAQLQELIDTTVGGPASSGVSVTPRKAMAHHAVATGVLVLSETVAQLPFTVRQRLPEGGSEVVEDHPVQRLLGNHGRPNAWMTSFEFRELGMRQTALRGNYYAFKNRARGELRELLPVHPNRVVAKQEQDFSISYDVTMPDGSKRTLGPSELFHLRGPSDDGFLGLDRVKLHRDDIGLALAQDLHASKLFANGARIAAVLEHPGTLSDPAEARLRKSFQEVYGGPENAHKTAILEEGMKFEKAGMTAEDSQLLDSRKLQRSVVAALWRIPPHMTGDLDKATFSNIENLARQFVDYALMPWLTRWEQACELQLLSDAEREGGLFVKIDPRALLRGNAKERADFYNKGVSGLWMSPNEVRDKEDLPPREGGDEFINPNIDTGEDDDQSGAQDDPDNPEAQPPALRLAR